MYVGVDVGTSVVKAAAFAHDGSLRGLAARPMSTHSPFPSWAEQHLPEITSALHACLSDLAETTGGSHAELIAITAHGDGLWLLDRDGMPVRPGIVWSDGRAAPIVDEWNATGLSRRAFERSGHVPFPGSMAPLLRCLSRDEPASVQSATTATSCKDVVYQMLTGARVTDLTDASLPFLDPARQEYSDELLELYGLTEYRHLLPPIETPPAARPLSRRGAHTTGLPEGTPVVCGPFDFPATSIGVGLRKPGDGVLAFGTTLACGVLIDRLDLSGEPSGMTLSLNEPGRWLRLLPAMAGTMALDWLLPLISASHDELDGLLALSEPGAGGVMLLPFLAPAGERAPFVDPSARGRLVGLSTSTTRADIARAACEGVAFAARHCFDVAGLAEDGVVYLAGGGAKSRAVRQVLADTLGRPVATSAMTEPGTRGTVLSALRALEIGVNEETWTGIDSVTKPDPTRTRGTAQRYAYYLEETDRARGNWAAPVP